MDCTNARLVRYEFGLVADIPVSNPFQTQYFLSLVFIKQGREIREVFAVKEKCDIGLEYLNKIVERKEESGSRVQYYFTDGCSFWFD